MWYRIPPSQFTDWWLSEWNSFESEIAWFGEVAGFLDALDETASCVDNRTFREGNDSDNCIGKKVYSMKLSMIVAWKAPNNQQTLTHIELLQKLQKPLRRSQVIRFLQAKKNRLTSRVTA
jgi:hypothetical protein